MNETVAYKELVNAVIKVDNSVEDSKTYLITCNVRVSGMGNAESFEGGTVSDNGVLYATFNSYGGAENLNINFQNADTGRQAGILESVQAFIADVKQKVAESSPLKL